MRAWEEKQTDNNIINKYLQLLKIIPNLRISRKINKKINEDNRRSYLIVNYLKF